MSQMAVDIEDIDFDKFPDQFVLKCTHDSNSVVICRDKSKLDIDAARTKINNAMRRNYFYKGREYPSIFIGKTFSTVRGQVSTLTHEVLHALGLPHSFQLYGAYENKFCLPFAQTTNIMDYNTIAYSLRQYQWEVMREEAYQPCKEYYKLTHQKKQ